MWTCWHRCCQLVELHVIEGDVKGTRFLDFGGVVCEMFYRADLTVYGL